MKYLIFLLLPLSVNGQIKTYVGDPHEPIRSEYPDQMWHTKQATWSIKSDIKPRHLLTFSLGFMSGACGGALEVFKNHPNRIPDSWNKQFWDPSLSWTNKYKNNDPEQGRAFVGSMGPLVWVTDGYHLTSMGHKVFGLSTGVSIGYKANNWKQVALNTLIGSIGYSIGFYGIYKTKIIFK